MDPDVHSTRATLTAKEEVLPTKEKKTVMSVGKKVKRRVIST